MSVKSLKEKLKIMRRRFKKWRSWDEKPETIPLCEGIAIDESLYEIHEKRMLTLILKGIIVYLLTMGGMGAYLTAIGCRYSDIFLNIIILATAILCSVLYYSYKVENLGYLIFFVFFAALIYLFRNYINSGFYAVVNDTIKEASYYLEMDGMQEYNERISNRYLAITVAMSFIGIVSNILLNNYISRRMRYIVGTVIASGLLVIPLYLEHEPSTVYTVMLISGIVMSYFYRGGGHYKLHRSESVFGENMTGIGYNADSKIVKQMLIYAIGFTFFVVSIVTVIFPKDRYDSMHKDYIYKTNTSEYVISFFAYGLAGLFNFYPNNGGLNSGELGGVSAVHLDFMTDLKVWYTPYSYNTLYIRNFVGRDYVPYKNYWMRENAEGETKPKNKLETDALREAFNKGEEFSAEGVFTVKNVEAPNLPYVPYYSDGDDVPISYGNTSTYTYYPRLGGNDAKVKPLKLPETRYDSDGNMIAKLGDYEIIISAEERKYTAPDYVSSDETGEYLKKLDDLTDDEYIDPGYLYIPSENYEVIEEFSKNAGLAGTNEEIIDGLDRYFEENIPYTIRPGATPRKEDFINHFLTKGKKGYCSYFASTAVMVFRYFGIPARYVEGYAVSFDTMSNGTLVEDAKYSDYYKGFSEIGETGLVEVDVSDASAHAWVEVYDKNFGWTVVDVTPPGSEEDTVDFWSNFQRAFDDGDEDAVADDTEGFNIEINDKLMRKLIYLVFALAGLFILIMLVRLILPGIMYSIRYSKAGTNDRLIMEYSRRMKRLGRRIKPLREKVNYRARIEYLMEEGFISLSEEEKERYLDIMEKAGFSKTEIDDASYRFAREINLRKLSKSD